LKKPDALRLKAEEQLAVNGKKISSLRKADLTTLAHELAVHQTELELQNEELRQSRIAAEEARDRYLNIYDFAPMGYVTLDKHSRIIEANLRGCDLLHIGKRNIKNKPFTKFISEDENDKFYVYRQKVLKNDNKQTLSLKMKTADGTLFYAQLDSIKDGAERLRIAFTNISELKKEEEKQKENEERIFQLNESLIRQTQELRVINKELEGYGFTISNNLKAPLRHMQGFSQALLEDCSNKLETPCLDYLHRIDEAGKLMSLFLDKLLELSSVSMADLNYEEVDLSELVRNKAEKVQQSCPEGRVSFVIQPDLATFGDFKLLKIVLEEMIDNALKFSQNVPHARIEFGVTKFKNGETYFLKDNGVGFDSEHAKNIFTPFGRLHQENVFLGTGIGLAIVQRIIHRHGGEIWAESKIDGGATFYFTLH
jgi:PAS domain S-box-containing protein